MWNMEMSTLDRRSFLTMLMSGVALAATPMPLCAKDGKGGGKGGGQGGGKGQGNSGDHRNDDHSGPGGGNDDEQGEDGDIDDEEDSETASTAVREGRATPLRELLKVVRRKYPGEVVDVRLQRRDGNLLYQVKVLDRHGRMINVRIDARTRLIVQGEGS